MTTGRSTRRCASSGATPTMLNRAVLLVRFKQPFLGWAARLDDSGRVPDSTDEQTVYLIAEFEDDDQARRMLKRVFAEVFEREL